MADKQPARTDATTLLPLSRVRTIMKSSPDVSNIGQDALFAISKATVKYNVKLYGNAHVFMGDNTRTPRNLVLTD